MNARLDSAKFSFETFTCVLGAGVEFIIVTSIAVLLIEFPARASYAAQPIAKQSDNKLEFKTNSIGMKFVKMKAESFDIGSSIQEIESKRKVAKVELDKETFFNEIPKYRVHIKKDYWIGRHEVTTSEFLKFVESRRYKTTAEFSQEGGWGYAKNDNPEVSTDRKYYWANIGEIEWYGPAYPVVNVSWSDAKDFCEWLSNKENRNYKLPTECQWEYACRAGSEDMYCFGTDAEKLSVYGNVADSSTLKFFKDWKHPIKNSDRYPFLAPVGQFTANTWGIYDMHGNVSEICRDSYHDDFYDDRKESDDWNQRRSEFRVLRGSHCLHDTVFSACSYRHYVSIASDSAYSTVIGFRIVCEDGDPKSD